MAYICPYCGAEIEDKNRCIFCDRELGWVQKIYEKSNIYFSKGYYEAKARNLQTASVYLEKAIYYNKYNIEARNLLGLVYYEIGKIGSALKEWIISSSLKREDNLASDYLARVQDSPKTLVTYKDSIVLYNKSLIYLSQNNNDMAIIRLKKAVGLNPNLVEARNLLALCYIKEKKFHKANEQIKSVLLIDKANLKALIYFRELSEEDTSTVQPYEFEYIPRHTKNHYVNPSKVINRGHVLATSVAYFVVGMVCMLIVQTSLISPNKVKNYETQIASLKESEAKLSETLSTLNKESEAQIAALKSETDKLTKEKQDIELASSKMAQKEKISQASELRSKREWVKAAEALYNVAPSLLDPESKEVYNQLKEEVYERAASLLGDEGQGHFNRGEYADAKAKLEKAILYEPTPRTKRKSLYFLGKAEKEQDNKEKAKYYFETVINEFPKTNEAYWANKELQQFNQE